MGSRKRIQITPPWERLPKITGRTEEKVQMNPGVAVSQSESRASARQYLAIASMLMVLTIVFWGVRFVRDNHQKTTVKANINFSRAVTGIVVEVDYENKRFALESVQAFDPAYGISQVAFWTVYLPPGSTFSDSNKFIESCYVTASLDNPSGSLKAADCGDTVKSGSKLLIEYISLSPKNAEMTARRIIGEEKVR